VPQRARGRRTSGRGGRAAGRPRSTPHVIVVAGPNGAGKSTAAPHLLRDTLAVTEFVNADTIASGLSAFRPDSAALAAGRIMLGRMRELVRTGANFAFETTLASRSFAPWLRTLAQKGCRIDVLLLWLESADLAAARVAARVRRGGHDVPADVIRRRYGAGLRNPFALYMPLAHGWQVFDNSGAGPPRLVAASAGRKVRSIADRAIWRRVLEGAHGS
jgi:predicted ABC-type ATPase